MTPGESGSPLCPPLSLLPCFNSMGKEEKQTRKCLPLGSQVSSHHQPLGPCHTACILPCNPPWPAAPAVSSPLLGSLPRPQRVAQCRRSKRSHSGTVHHLGSRGAGFCFPLWGLTSPPSPIPVLDLTVSAEGARSLGG